MAIATITQSMSIASAAMTSIAMWLLTAIIITFCPDRHSPMSALTRSHSYVNQVLRLRAFLVNSIVSRSTTEDFPDPGFGFNFKQFLFISTWPSLRGSSFGLNN